MTDSEPPNQDPLLGEPRPRWLRVPRPTLLTVAFLIGLVSGLMQMVQFVAWISSDDPPKGPWLFAVIALPTVSLLLVLAYVTVEFRRQLATTVENYQHQLEIVARESNASVESLTATVADLRTLADEQQKLQSLYKRVADRAHQLSVDLIRTDTDRLSDSDLARHLQQMCRAFAQLLSATLGYECRVCVKQIRSDNVHDYPYVSTVCRSRSAAVESAPIVHYIHLNSDFTQLLQSELDYWITGDILSLDDYQNTSPKREYRSVLIWSVPADQRLASVQLSEWRESTVAFLCADAREVNVFTEDHMLAGLPMVDMASHAFDLYLRSRTPGLPSEPGAAYNEPENGKS